MADLALNKYLLIARSVDHFQLKELSALPIFKLGRHNGGFIKITEFRRDKPYRSLASRTVGEDRDKNPVGLENSFNRLLRGEIRNVLQKRVAKDLWIPIHDPTDYEIVKGKDLITTINVPMQDIVHNELKKGMFFSADVFFDLG